MERFFDIFLSALGLLVFSPLLIFVALILRFSGEGEILFLQERVGRNRKVFNIFKFATMLKDSPKIGTGTISIKNDPRVLPVGKILRRTKINELPQLLNILIGDMSIVGPRPLTSKSFDFYSFDSQQVIKTVKPGLSGIGSIVFRGEEDIINSSKASSNFYENVIAPYKGQLEEWYVLNKSLYTYFLAILVTVWTVLVPNTKMIWIVFKDLPKPPKELKNDLHYS
ncbi:MAG: lipid carrier--UDP-N-acetylgalactosaminyltransferase [Flavobacteriales bacterium]|jgi:lipopolysaccharide/colanic/teichoic acid biosynthesis glycosyltransferase|nr:lipid carrier--UDP-N-acetylgalactosaminyltransferase [Flavobacteriales bacterium]|tara:strand:+ start:1844 stop:2518 length:675 start_codon:yes stop_codon:yes gene_type:complete